MTNHPFWPVALVTLLTVAVVVVFHFEVIAALNNWAHERKTRTRGHANQHRHHHRPTLLIVMFVLLATHVVEIGLFGIAFWLLIDPTGAGAIIGSDRIGFWDLIYFSVTNYTTVGWGDLSSIGPLRILAGAEALLGFMLITWSASFTYLVMARTWGAEE
ncbi:MAG: two pore domain potassium channel family protein [Gammaproteobacteria bacterium]|nr:MAG: two pore domain potassium channel family protein [Gammaproteobacteria bacterium]